jgi:hypothetical protein
MTDPLPEFGALKAQLQEGLAASMQGSYERRLPDKAALPKIPGALKGLRAMVKWEETTELFRTLALAEELLHYPAAVEALQKAIALSKQHDRKDLKRLVQLKECAAKWESLGLSPRALESLGQYLEEHLAQSRCDHTHRHTVAWLKANGIEKTDKAIGGLESTGGHCDCEVLLNAV